MRFSIITPSYNQGAFIERTIRSVLAQEGDFELEYLVVDGGSTDETVAILRRYEGRLRFVSEPDRGQSDAINKGFARTTGDVVAWLNSDDLYVPGALAAVAEGLRTSGARWCFGQCRIIDENDREIRAGIKRYKEWHGRHYTRRRLFTKDFIPQPATFFRREILEHAGGLNPESHLAMDYDLWLRFARIAEPLFIPHDLAAFRWYLASKSGANYGKAAWEAFASARKHARGVERFALVEHALHVVSLTASYKLLDVVRPVLERRRS